MGMISVVCSWPYYVGPYTGGLVFYAVDSEVDEG